VLNQDIIDSLRIPGRVIGRVAAAEQRELERRDRTFRGGQPFPTLSGHSVIVVDDGSATGASMRVAITEPLKTSKGTLWRVRVGPYPSRDAALAARDKLKTEGQSGIVAAIK
jgi:predicted phosphoribosyltransferase